MHRLPEYRRRTPTVFIRQLQYLVTLARERHFGRAADACNVSQPTLSGALRSIEQEFGMVIVLRGRRFQGFTPEGERVLAWARRVLADCEGLRQEALGSERNPAGLLRIGAIPTTQPLLPLLTAECMQRYGQLRHEIHTLPSSVILRGLNEFELDIGMSYLEDERLASFGTVPLFRERYVLVARDDAMFHGRASIDWDEAARLPLCLLTREMQCRRGIDAAFARAGHDVQPCVETDSMLGLYAHVRCAGLYGVVPHSVLCLLEMRQEITAIPLLPELGRDIGLVLPMREPRPPLVEAALTAFRAIDLQRRVDALLAAPD